MSKGDVGEFGEPWIASGTDEIKAQNDGYGPVGVLGNYGADGDSGALMGRAVTCVNAFDGIKHPEHLPELLEAVRAEFNERYRARIHVALFNLMGGPDV